LALPILEDFTNIERVGSELDLVSHLGVKSHCGWDNVEDPLNFFIVFDICTH